MTSTKTIAAELKQILEQVQSPAALDEHPWAKSLWVKQFCAQQPEFEAHSAGYQLLSAFSALFREILPGTPPRRGKRIDTRWGQFGIVGALYFAPFEFGATRPASLLDAWGNIDDVILKYAYPQSTETLLDEEIELYRLVGDEHQAGPVSTLSDWHLRGLERLAEHLRDREQLLSAQYACDSIVLNPQTEAVEIHALADPPERPPQPLYRRYARKIGITLLLILAVFFGWQGVRTYQLYRAFKADVDQLQHFLEVEPSLEMVEEVGDLLAQTRQDVLALQSQVQPYRWGGGLLGWLPVYGGDLAEAGNLIDMAAALIIAGDEAYRAGIPLLETANTTELRPSIPEILNILSDAQPGFETAQLSMEEALLARSAIDIERLSPKTRPLLEKIDPYLPLLDDGLPALAALPKVLGAADAGPQTYLILMQNEDEIRATGGFITAYATLTIENGEIIGFQSGDSYDLDNYEKHYPTPPWQLNEYMGVWQFLFRNTNWSPDFPTSALWAEYTYAVGNGHSVDGVIALDQEAVRLLLMVLGPLDVEGISEPITAENVLELMRVVKDQSRRTEGGRKSFIGLMAEALFDKLQNDTELPWQDVAQLMMQAFEERHIQLQIDDPAIAGLAAYQGWDGAVAPRAGDFLMVVDSNLGWNKANAAVQSEIAYEVNLSALSSPTAKVTTWHRNPTEGDDTCRHGYYYNPEDTYQDYAERCYWNYLRVYTLTDTELLEATPHALPAKWSYRENAVPPRVDILDNEGIVDENPPGLRGYGTMIVIPLNEERQTGFEFALPAEIILTESSPGTWTYRLYIQKQAGTRAIPLTLQINLPSGVQFVSASLPGNFQDDVWQADLTLRTDIEITLNFTLP